MPLTEFISECHKNLVNNTRQEVSVALEYISSLRALLLNSIITHKIGYCSVDAELPDCIRFLGQDASDEEKKWDMSYVIRGRIIVPIYSEFNKPVGFATRVPSTLPGDTWWNTPFKKSNHLFLFNRSKRKAFTDNKIYLVEGYMDALILHQTGLENVSCIMGTALTSRKIALIARYCNNVCLCFDSDKNQAGQNAQKMAIAILKKFDFCENISIIEGLPTGEDPDVFVTKNGLETFLKMERTLKPIELKRICKAVSDKRKEVVNAQ